jgi:hypothetical protein
MAGANGTTSGLNPFFMFVLMASSILCCAICIGCNIFGYNKHFYVLKVLDEKLSVVIAEEADVEHVKLGSPNLGTKVQDSDGQQDAEAFTSDEDKKFEEGAEVCISGLVERPEDNGTTAEVIRYDAEKTKYVVRTHAAQKKVMVKPENLTLARSQSKTGAEGQDPSFFEAGTKVAIVGLTQNPEENGTLCEVIIYNAQKGKYVVNIVKSQRRIELRPENVILAFCQGMLEDLDTP